MPDPGLPNEPKPIAEVASLFDTDEVRPISVPPVPESDSTSGGYDLEPGPTPELDEPVRPVVIPEPVERPRVSSKSRPRSPLVRDETTGSSEFDREASHVDPIWTRWGEWGPDLIRVGIAGAGTIFLVWLFSGSFTLCILSLIAGATATVLLSYPILITLERPVRITPEQAVLDFFAAASHHNPHYRRMWLLLSSAGRDAGPFPSFEDFREHWKRRIDGWRASRGAHRYSPLEFAVENFQADKSTGKETSKAEYTVRVALRDDPGNEPIQSFRMAHGLVKGPDRMWYLNRGVLPIDSL